MTVFRAFYEKKAETLRREHDKWVESNFKLRSIELALSQIESKGDIKIDPAEKVLRDEYTKEFNRNENLCREVHSLKAFVRSMEVEAREHNEEWTESIKIFGY